MYKIFTQNLKEFTKGNILKEYIPLSVLERLEGLNSPRRTLEVECTGYLIYKGLKEAYNLSDEDIRSLRIERAERGKPFLPDYPDIHFNISHSEDEAVIVFSDSEIGVDIQYKKRKLTEHLELKVLYPGNEMEEKLDLIDVFSMKEAYVKYTGEGISIPFEKIFIDTATKAYIIDGEVKAHYDKIEFSEDYAFYVAY
jgi:4'-phosphopantetheinyl transferase